MSLDLVVIGAGMAGMVAAVRAAGRGLKVAVLEKGEGERYPCNTRLSGGIIHIAFVDPKREAADILAAIEGVDSGGAEPDLASALAESVSPAIDFLRSEGARFLRAGGQEYQNWMLAPPRRLIAGMDWEGRGPDVLLRGLAQRLAAHGGTLHRGTRAIGLTMRDGTCTGVETANGAFRARAVLIADGGFQANTAMLSDHITATPPALKQRGAATGMGDGLAMARAAGAAITDLSRFYGHLLCRDAMHNDKVWPYPELDGIAVTGMLVDAAGNRLVDEGLGGVNMANALARSPDPLGGVIVFDAAIWDGPGRSARIPANPALENAGGTILRAGSLNELAGLAGIQGDALAASVAAHNQAIAAGTLSDLSPPRSTERFKPWPIATAPFMAIPCCAGITYTMGGIRIDRDARVLSDAGTPIRGLYAAGSCTGGLEGGANATYLGGLAKAAAFGLRAADHIAVTNETTIREQETSR